MFPLMLWSQILISTRHSYINVLLPATTKKTQLLAQVSNNENEKREGRREDGPRKKNRPVGPGGREKAGRQRKVGPRARPREEGIFDFVS